MNDWECHAGGMGARTRCTHPECKPTVTEYATLGDAQDALIHALDIVRTIHVDIAAHREVIADKEERIRMREDELRHWSSVAKRALPLVAMGFHMTAKDDNA